MRATAAPAQQQGKCKVLVGGGVPVFRCGFAARVPWVHGCAQAGRRVLAGSGGCFWGVCGGYSQASTLSACDRGRHKASRKALAEACWDLLCRRCPRCTQPATPSDGEALTPARCNGTSVQTPQHDTAPWGGDKKPALRLCLQVSELPESSKIPTTAKSLP